MSSQIDYECDDAPPVAAAAGGAQASAAIDGPTIAEELRDAQTARDEAAAPMAHNRNREQARISLENLTWLTIDGQEIPARWTVFAESYYEALSSFAGLSGDGGEADRGGQVGRLYIWMWLALHPAFLCLRRNEETGLALKDHKALWLETIFAWADREFPMGPDHAARREKAEDLQGLLLRLSYSSRAEPMKSLEPPTDEEDAPGKQLAPHG